MPLVPALVMLGLVAGAHGDSKSDLSRHGISQMERCIPPSRTLEVGMRPATRRDRMARYTSRPSVLERPPHLETTPLQVILQPRSSLEHPVESRMSLKVLQGGGCLSVTLFMGWR